ncbi:hypothetical protein VIOR3934_18925 [Vibrio orientalis CIP 102891 = ATCC 33934]|uniref:Lipoprotein n=1 Tax=Vibrio orientalis CIP 102891 = ATCC 33934 TaxID=675816 RepID=C9QEP5_VIBOR|nr:hypothetical protein [Vibrio orientalis]EEX94518.1 hypothetical protein VIA_001678 [Vibrio orientalis CIP 102891 = ATCC 33934]EGU53930.1 hypothetical protein VIOR3934_18925 [Vibrio orientalis CIP 102891 = ATCC 33934]
MESKQWNIKLGVVGILSTALLGCSEQEAERIINKKTYSFVGIYDNQYNGDLLEFNDAILTVVKDNGESFSKPFEVDDGKLIIRMRNSSKEKRDDIVMRIHGDNELLTCSVCAKYQLSSTWLKRLD